MSGVKKRQYQSATRDDGARRTRQAVVAAAAELFISRGYASTTLADVAGAAGVARPTVFAAVGSKAALLKLVLDQALSGDDEPVAVADRPWFAPVWEATTPGAVLDAYADVCVLIGSRAAKLFETVRQAADASPEAAELWTTSLANRRAGAAMVVEHAGLGGGTAIDILWIYNDPSLYAALVGQRGWTEPAFRSWLARAMRAALLDQRPSTSRVNPFVQSSNSVRSGSEPSGRTSCV